MSVQGVQGKKVVARYADGRLVKGYTFDFHPTQPRFHIFPSPSASGSSMLILMRELKALFFVRDFAGDPAHQEHKRFRPGERGPGQPVEVFFKDGEIMVGSAETSIREAPGFFLVPADAGSNNLRVFVVTEATRNVQPIDALPAPARPATARPGDGGARHGGGLPRRLLGWLSG